jgi:hypothetical protein
MSGEDKTYINTQLHLWAASDKFSRTSLWALACYGLIPEMVSIYTSATTCPPS